MLPRFARTLISTSALVATVGFAGAAAAADAMASLRDTRGRDVGQVLFTATPNGTLLHLTLRNLPPGTHAFHVHETGSCIPPFTSAGGHLNPGGTGHGLMDADGMHAGDMPNIHVPISGALEQEILNVRLTLDDAVFDADGAAVVIHAGADDYRTNPAGAAGARLACGVVER